MAQAANPTLSGGRLVSDKVIDKISKSIERGSMVDVHAIVVHQTGGPTAQSALNSYSRPGANGAHFLIDKDGTIYQTARTNQRCSHVGKIQSRCYKLKTCSVDELKNVKQILFNQAGSYEARVKKLHRHEMGKSYPDRYPSNEDSIGIELVAEFSQKHGYESATAAQNDSLRWLVSTLENLLKLSASDVYRHSEVSYKQPSEATSARW
jgi:N-acetyl-anhydromuramyl-L-alanine amidase AmpD